MVKNIIKITTVIMVSVVWSKGYSQVQKEITNRECVLDRKVSIIDSLIVDLLDIPPL